MGLMTINKTDTIFNIMKDQITNQNPEDKNFEDQLNVETTRKKKFPTIYLGLVVLIGLFGYFFFNSTSTYNEYEKKIIAKESAFSQVLDDHQEMRKDSLFEKIVSEMHEYKAGLTNM